MRIQQYLTRRQADREGKGSFPLPPRRLHPASLCAMGMGLGLTYLGAQPAVSETAPNPSWSKLYNGAGNFYDYARATTVDTAGNVYVTGSSDGDYVTVKYGPTGSQLWAARYDGPRHGLDTPTAIVVDSAGNVYVTGASYGGNPALAGTDFDFATVKYDPAGDELWVVRYDGPAGREDAAAAMTLDSEENLCVAGTSSTLATGKDFTLIKYSPAGEELWTSRYDGTGGADTLASLAIGSDDTLVVTGESWGGVSLMDFATVKFSAAGTRLWAARFDGNLAADAAVAVAVDSTGAVYVTGATDGGPAGAGGSELDYATLKYTDQGGQVWLKRYDSGSRNLDVPAALAVDVNGNVFVTGRSRTPTGGYGFLTLAYNTGGTQLWSDRYDASGNRDDYPTGLVATGVGTLYIAGQATAGSGRVGFATLKYSLAGSRLWVARYDGPTNGDSAPVAMALQGDDALVVAGTAWGTSGTQDYATLKYLIGASAPPSAPSGLVGAPTSAGDVLLTWQDTSGDEAGFRIERKLGRADYVEVGTVGAGVTNFVDMSAALRSKYRYRVVAFNALGSSAPSNELAVNLPARLTTRISVSPTKVKFPRVRIGSTGSKSVTVRNLGSTILTGRIVAPSTPFSAASEEFTLYPRARKQVSVQFAPTATGDFTGELQVESNDPKKPVAPVKLSGKGF